MLSHYCQTCQTAVSAEHEEQSRQEIPGGFSMHVVLDPIDPAELDAVSLTPGQRETLRRARANRR